jgi:hypothetical protein
MIKHHQIGLQKSIKTMMNLLEAVLLGIQITLLMNSMRRVKNQKNLCVAFLSFKLFAMPFFMQST